MIRRAAGLFPPVPSPDQPLHRATRAPARCPGGRRPLVLQGRHPTLNDEDRCSACGLEQAVLGHRMITPEILTIQRQTTPDGALRQTCWGAASRSFSHACDRRMGGRTALANGDLVPPPQTAHRADITNPPRCGALQYPVRTDSESPRLGRRWPDSGTPRLYWPPAEGHCGAAARSAGNRCRRRIPTTGG